MKGISVIICCYNSALRIADTIRHLALQKVSPDILWEIIIVNNASADNTVEVAAQTWKQVEIPEVLFKILEQPISGLSSAREMGVLNAQYCYGIFCDDDNWLFPDFIQKSYDVMDSDKVIGLLGSYGIPVFESGKEVPWFKDCFEYFAVGSQQGYALMYGAGAIYRLEPLKTIYKSGFKSLLSDRKGNSLSAGGDMELSILISLMGFDIVANDNLKFYHFMPDSRMRKEYINKLIWDGAKSIACLIPHFYKLNKIERKEHQKRWFWIMLVEMSLFVKQYVFSNHIFKWDYRNQLKRNFAFAKLLGIYENRATINEGFQALESASWLETYKTNNNV